MDTHYLPQNYLRQFASTSNPDKVWQYDKSKGEFKLLPIKAVGKRKDFYDGPTEQWLNNYIEGPANYALDKLRSGQDIDDEGRTRVAIYLDSMLKRVPHLRRRLLEIAPEKKKRLFETIRNDLESRATDYGTTSATLMSEIDRLEKEGYVENLSMTDDLVRQQWVSPEIVKTIHSMTWRVLATRRPERFLTGDRPVFFTERIGLSGQESEFTFPLSEGVVLHGSWQQLKGQRTLEYLEPRPAIVKEINRRQIFAADRFLFSHQNAPWIMKVSEESPRRLNRIVFP